MLTASVNRTILELKFVTSVCFCMFHHAVNRTILELKFDSEGFDEHIRGCQSYHTGIEIMEGRYLSEQKTAVNRTILELK